MLSPTWQLTGGLLSLPALGARRAGPATAIACWHLFICASAVDTACGGGSGPGLAGPTAGWPPGGRDAVSDAVRRDQGHWLVCCLRFTLGRAATGLLRNTCAMRRRPRLPPRRRACSASHRGHPFPSWMAARRAAPGIRLFELAGDTATSPAYLLVSIGPYRENPAPWTVLEAGTLWQESPSCPRFSPAHHIRRTVRVGRTATGQLPCWRAQAGSGQAESTTSGMVPAFLMPSPFSPNRLVSGHRPGHLPRGRAGRAP
jgi:hypothetical protein